jgi:hypothetical protein
MEMRAQRPVMACRSGYRIARAPYAQKNRSPDGSLPSGPSCGGGVRAKADLVPFCAKLET